MYTLRKITGKDVELNFNLGNSYTLVHSERSPEEFKRSMDNFLNPDENIYAFVGNEDGSKLYALYKKQLNFIMTESGQTFSNLTMK